MPQVTAGPAKPSFTQTLRERLRISPPAANHISERLPLHAKIYNLDILDADILDENTNTTRFLIMSRDTKASDPNKPTMTTIFEVRSVPAVLYKCLGGFATNNINLTKLGSYMLGGSMKAARFYADCEGHIDNPAMTQALEELQFYCTDGGITVLGSYPANRG